MKLLEGKVAIVTGAGRGVGRAEAMALAAQGASVVVNDLGVALDGAAGEVLVADEVVDEIVGAGGKAVANNSDITTLEGVDALIWDAVSKFGGLDILVNNAGVLRDKTLLNMSEDDWDLVQKVHGKGMFLCTRAAGRVMKSGAKGGVIINTTSVSGMAGLFGQANYAFAKAGTYAFTKLAAMELARYGIRVHAVSPNAITRMTTSITGMSDIPEDILSPQATAPLVVYLASDLAKDLTGRVIGLHGGSAGSKAFEFKMKASQGYIKENGLPGVEEIADNIDAILFGEPDLVVTEVLGIK